MGIDFNGGCNEMSDKFIKECVAQRHEQKNGFVMNSTNLASLSRCNKPFDKNLKASKGGGFLPLCVSSNVMIPRRDMLGFK